MGEVRIRVLTTDSDLDFQEGKSKLGVGVRLDAGSRRQNGANKRGEQLRCCGPMSQPSRLFLGILQRCSRAQAQVVVLLDIQYQVFDMHKGEVMRPITEIPENQKRSQLTL